MLRRIVVNEGRKARTITQVIAQYFQLTAPRQKKNPFDFPILESLSQAIRRQVSRGRRELGLAWDMLYDGTSGPN